MPKKDTSFILPFSQISKKDLPIVGGKGANLGELTKLKIPVPNGFAITIDAYNLFLKNSGIEEKIYEELEKINIDDPKDLEKRAKKVRDWINKVEIPQAIEQDVIKAYSHLSGFSEALVAVRSSATAEDLPTASFAGQQSTFLNVKGVEDLLEKVRACWASLFEARSIFYRVTKGFKHREVAISVIVQKMIQAEAAGVLFTVNPVDNDETKIAIEAVLGLGETVVSGAMTPDQYLIDKKTLKILQKNIVNQEWMLVRKGRTKKGEDPNVKVKISDAWQRRQKIEDKHIERLAKIGKVIEKHYKTPQDIEWAYEGGKVWIVQTRPVTTIEIDEQDWKKKPTATGLKTKLEEEKPQKKIKEKAQKELPKEKPLPKPPTQEKEKPQEEKGPLKPKPFKKPSPNTEKAISESEIQEKLKELELLLTGSAASPGYASGKISLIKTAKEMSEFKDGNILVTAMTTPSWVPIMKKAVGIITDQGGATCHAAIVSRELGIPCVVGTQIATKILREDEPVTMNGSEGKIYSGEIAIPKPQKGAGKRPSQSILEKIRGIKKLRKSIEQRGDKVEKKEKDRAEVRPAQEPTKEPSEAQIPQPEEVKKIRTATKIYVNLAEPDLAQETAQRHVDGVGLLRAEFMMAEIGIHPKYAIKKRGERKNYVKKLTEGILTFAKAFAPRPVIYRTNDFKTNEYQTLRGGKEFEFDEANPMIGFRGAHRYLDSPDVLNLELEAIKNVRNKENHKNVWVMVPFIRTVEELKEIKVIISNAGLKRSSTFNLFLMIEVPSNVILIDEFLKVGVDGVSIGTNDLTQLILGIDRDNPKLQDIFDERDPSVLWALERVIKACQKHGAMSSICGQAPSVYPEITEKLVEWGITSISVNPDMIEKTRSIIAEKETSLIKVRGVRKSNTGR